jgi:ABC-type multidrug transport system fused ATPase/permease subunit
MIFGPFAIVSRNWQVIQNSMVSVERVNEYLTMPTEDTIDKNKKDLETVDGKIVFKNVHFSYKEEGVKVLNSVSFTVNAGETVALVGESGVGKSTTIQLLSGYYFPNKGTVFIDGQDISLIKRNSLRKHIAVVPQEVVLFNDTILNNIRYGNFEKNEEEIHNAARQAHADSFIERFPEKYNQLVGERGIKLSVGEKQRVAIARAILRDPKILILDEPTSALDPQTERQITNSLEKLMQGRTTFIIAHRLSTVRQADKIFVFDKGRIVEEGNHEQLLAQNGLYKKLHDLHVGLH